MDKNQESTPQMQIELSPELAEGKYVNLALINHSNSEFVIDFASVMPGLTKATVRSRVIIAPEHAKRLLMALQENLLRFESKFGKILLPEQQASKTISPFNVKKHTDA